MLTAWGVAFRPSTALAALPGSTCSARKIKIDAASSASRAPTIRCARNAATGEARAYRLNRGMATAVIPATACVSRAWREDFSRREPHGPEVVVTEDPAGVWLQALDVLRHAVDVICVRPAHVAALLVLDLL